MIGEGAGLDEPDSCGDESRGPWNFGNVQCATIYTCIITKIPFKAQFLI